MSAYNEILNDYNKRSRKAPKLTEQRERALIKLSKQGSSIATEQLIESNLYLVIIIVREYRFGTEIMADLLQEGYIGLVESIEHFDLSRDTRFSTYARWWVKRSIQEYLEKNHRNIRLPRNMQRMITQVQDTYFYLYQQLEHPPTQEEISHYLNTSTKKVDTMRIHESYNYTPSTPEEAETPNPIEQLQSSPEDNPEEQLLHKDLNHTINQAIQSLSDTEKKILNMRFNPLKEYSIQEIGAALKLSDYKVRKHLEEALKKLKAEALAP